MPIITYTWIDGTTGNWGTAADWSGGVVPTGFDNATIAGTGTETVTVSTDQAVNLLTLDDANATFVVTTGATLSVYGGLTVSSVQAIDVNGTLLIGGGSQTIDNSTINLGEYSSYEGALTTNLASDTSAVLTLGPDLTINSAYGLIESGSAAGDGIVNQGMINVTGYLEIYGNAITNQGTISGKSFNLATDEGAFINQGAITADGSGGDSAISVNYAFDNEGTIAVTNGDTLTLQEYIYESNNNNNGTISVGSGGRLILNNYYTVALAGTGSMVINDGGTLELKSALANTVDFAGVGTLQLDAPNLLTGALSGLNTGDVIDFANATVANAVVTGSTLTVTFAGGSTENLTLATALPAEDSLQTTIDGAGGTDVVVATGPLPPPPTYTWIDGTTGNWGTAADWSGGVVPTGFDNATIAGTGTETVTVSTDQAVNLLTLDDANATFVVTTGATLSVYGGLTVSSVQAIDVNGTLLIGGGSQTIDNSTINLGEYSSYEGALTTNLASDTSAVLTLGPDLTINSAYGLIESGSAAGDGIVNQGMINVTGYLEIYGNAITNQGTISGKSFNLATDEGAFINQGAITADGSGGDSAISVNYAFDNEGTIAVTNGDTLTLQEYIYESNNNNNGTISVGSGGRLILNNYYTVALAGTGSMVINDGGTLELKSALANTVDFAGVGTLQLDAPNLLTGALSGLNTGDVIDFANATVANAVVTGSTLTVTFAGGSTENLTLATALPAEDSLQTTIDGAGGTDVVVATGPLPPPPTYTWIDGTTGNWGTAADWSGGVVPTGFDNATIAGTGTETVTVSTDQAVNLLTLDDANATFVVTTGATLSVYGGLTVSSVQAIDVNGTLLIGGGSQTIDNSTINLGEYSSYEGALTTNLASDTSAVLTLGPDLTINSAYGLIESGSAAGDGIVNQGMINVTGYLEIYGNAITNQGTISGKSFNLATDEGAFINQGAITADGSGGDSAISVNYAFDNEGTIAVTNGDTLTLQEYIYESNNNNNGTISVGSGGRLILNNYYTVALAGTGSMVINDGGTLELKSALANTVDFAGVGTLQLDAPNLLTGALSGLNTGDVIDFANATVANAVVTGSTLTVTFAGGSTENLTLATALPVGDYFSPPQLDGAGGTELVVSPTVISETVPSSLTGNENAAISLSGISVSDPGNVGDSLSTVLTVSNGIITVGTPGGTVISNNGTDSVTLVGTAAAIDAALETTNYTGNTNYYGSDSLSATTTDGGGNTSGTYLVPIAVIGSETWAEGVNGTWQTAADWTPAIVPGSYASTFITAPGTYTVTDSQTTTVVSVATAASATLAITGDTFTITGGTGADANAGTMTVEDGAALDILPSTVTNTGTLQATGGGTLNFDGTNVSNAGGAVTVGTSSTLNLNNATITGGTLSNAATVDVMGGTTSTLDGVSFSNGTAATLALDGNGFANFTSGRTSASVTLTTANANDVIILDIVQNGTSVASVADADHLVWNKEAVAGTGSYTIYEYYAIAPNALSADTITVNFAGTASYSDLNAFGISGANTSSPFDSNASVPATPATSTGAVTTSNADDLIFAGYRFSSSATPAAGAGWTAINATGGYYLSEYQIVSATQAGLMATASTAGENGGIVDAIVQASASPAALTVVSGSTLDLDNTTITGGTLGNSGTVDSTGTSVLNGVAVTNSNLLETTGGTLTIDPSTVTNTGTLQATSGGTLNLNGISVSNTGGTVSVGSGSTLDLDNATINDGALSNAGTVDSTGTSVLNGVAVTNSGLLEATGGTLTIDPSTVTNTGTLQATGGGTLDLDGISVSNTGGTVNVSAGSTLNLDNATINGGALSNTGATDLTGASTSTLDGTNVSNAGGTVTVGTSSTLNLNDATITGGTLSNAATVDVMGGTTSTLDGVSFSNGTAATLALDGNGFANFTSGRTSASVTLTTANANDVIILDIVQNGTSVASVADADHLVWNKEAVAGTGSYTIYEYYAIAPNALSADTITVNFAGTASYSDLNAFGISGANTSSPFDSNASVPATPATSTGAVTTSNADDLIFAGYRFSSGATPAAGAGWTAINATGGYYLSEYQIVSATQAGLMATASTAGENGGIVDAVVQASASPAALTVVSGSTLDLDNTTITGGTLGNSGTVDSTGTSVLNGVAVTNSNLLETTGGTLTIDPSTVTNTGTLQATSGGTLNLNGISVSNTGGTVSVGSGSTLDLDNATINDGALSNAGTVDSTGTSVLNGVAVTNSGLLEATGGTLTIDPSTVTNTGTLQATGGGTLDLDGISVSNTGGTVNVSAGSTLNLDNATINGGALSNTGATDLTGASTSTLDGTNVSNAGGTVTVGTSSTLNLNDATITGGTLSNAATVDVMGGTTSTLDGVSFSNGTAATLALDGNGFANFTSGRTSASVTLTTANANDVIILDIVQNGTSVASVADADHLVWNKEAVAGTGSYTIYEYYAIAPNALSADTITVNFAGTASYSDLNAFGISGANTSSPFDSNASVPATPATSTGAVTTSNADDLIFAGYRFSSSATPAAGAGWTAINATGGYYLSEYQIVSATQAGLMATASTAGENGGIVDAIVQASASPAALTVVSGSTLDLDNTTITGGTLGNSGTVDSTGTSVLNGVAVTNSNLLETTGGTLTIDPSTVTNTGNLLADGGTLDITGAVTGAGTGTISGTNSVLEFGAASAENITFSAGAIGVLKLDSASSFAGTVAGLADGDSIDLANFQFSNNPTIANVTGTGAAGSTTNVTVDDGALTVTLQLLNQYASQFAVNAASYTLTADTNTPNHGTLFQLATPH